MDSSDPGGRPEDDGPAESGQSDRRDSESGDIERSEERTSSTDEDSSRRDTGSAGERGTEATPTQSGAGPDAPATDSVQQQREFLVACLGDTTTAKQRLPYAVSLLESDDRAVRVLAMAACCLVAVDTDDDEMVEYLVRRLSDRLSTVDATLELTTALDYLSSEYSEFVSEILAEIAAEQDDSDVPLPDVGNFTRNYYYGADPERDGQGRMRIAGEESEDDPREAVADRQAEERKKVEYERERDDREAESDEEEADDQGVANPEAMVRRTTEVSAIAVRSRFDELYIQGQRRDGRYATTYEALVGQGGDEQAVALRLLDRPNNKRHLPDFEAELGEILAGWADVGDHDHVLTLLDYGVEPQPWLATALASESLADRDEMDVVTALGNALSLVDAVSHLHQNDVVHAGLDPKCVLYPGETFDTVSEQAPLVDNVGLLRVYRTYFNPADLLDPRYAAPEYYSRQFGRVDHSTDIYQLGAVVYRLFTDRPPHTGDYDRIRGAVLESNPPPPSTVTDDVPDAIDDVISKSMAKQKIRRYETVEHFHQELASIADEYEYV